MIGAGASQPGNGASQPGYSASRAIGWWKRFYENLPLPPNQAAGVALDVALDRLWPAKLPGNRLVQRTAGTGLALAGAAFTYWAWEERRRRTVGAFELERPEGLVTTGPYAINRHPMYLGWRLIHLGTGLALGTSWVLVTFPAAMVVEFIGLPGEEAATAKMFGNAYADYAARVPRYFPAWPSGTKPRERN